MDEARRIPTQDFTALVNGLKSASRVLNGVADDMFKNATPENLKKQQNNIHAIIKRLEKIAQEDLYDLAQTQDFNVKLAKARHVMSFQRR